MDGNRFFRFVWRFNALLLALGGGVIAVMVVWNLFSWRHYEPQPEGHFAPVPKGAEKASTYRLRRMQISVGQEDIFQLGQWGGSPEEYGLEDVVKTSRSEYHGPDTVNLLAVDGRNGSSHWLFHGFSREIVSEDAIVRKDPSGSTTVALLIQTIDTDTDKDGALTSKDKQSLYVYRPGMAFAEKLIDVDYIISSDQTDDGSYLVVYERGKSAVAATFSVPDFNKTSEKPIPAVPN